MECIGTIVKKLLEFDRNIYDHNIHIQILRKSHVYNNNLHTFFYDIMVSQGDKMYIHILYIYRVIHQIISNANQL